MGTNECSQPASKSSWDSQDFGDVNMVLKMVHFHKSSRPQWVKAQPGPFGPGDIYDLSGWIYSAHFGLYHVKKYQEGVCNQRL